jgi:hypothetical protein
MAPEDPDPGMFWLSSPPQRSPSRMSFRSRAVCRSAPVVLALIAFSACGVFESQGSEFPDAGPNEPDSLYAGSAGAFHWARPACRRSSPPAEYRRHPRAALDSVGTVAAARGGTSCLRHDST